MMSSLNPSSLLSIVAIAFTSWEATGCISGICSDGTAWVATTLGHTLCSISCTSSVECSSFLTMLAFWTINCFSDSSEFGTHKSPNSFILYMWPRTWGLLRKHDSMRATLSTLVHVHLHFPVANLSLMCPGGLTHGTGLVNQANPDLVSHFVLGHSSWGERHICICAGFMPISPTDRKGPWSVSRDWTLVPRSVTVNPSVNVV